MADLYVQRAGAWFPIGSAPPIDPGGPGTGGPDPIPGELTHGRELAATSLGAAAQIGPFGNLTPAAGATRSGTVVIEGREISGIETIAVGADVTYRNCRIIGPLGSTTYVIRATNGGGCRVTLEDCEVVARSTTSKTPRCITMWGDGNVRAIRSILRGGIDNVFVNPTNSPGVWATGDALVPMARVHLVECWLGDLQRVPGSHTDNLQIDGGGYTLAERCRFMSYSMPEGADPLTTRITDTVTAELGGGGVIATQASTNPNQLSHIAMRNCWHEGGNYTVDLAPSDGLPPHSMACTGGRFGVRSRFGPLRLPSGSENRDNRWGQSGVAPSGSVTADQPLQGSAP